MHKVAEMEMNKPCVDHLTGPPRLWLLTLVEILKMGKLIDLNSRLFQNDFQRLAFPSWCFFVCLFFFF